MSRTVSVDCVERGLSIVTVDAANRVVEIRTFEREEENVIYTDSKLVIENGILVSISK